MKRKYKFYVYILTNYKRSTFYIGITNNIIRRMIEHKKGIGCDFTKKYKLKYLIYFEEYKYINDAIAREKELKKWRREKKINLVKTINAELRDLSRQLFKDYGIIEKEIDECINGQKIILK